MRFAGAARGAWAFGNHWLVLLCCVWFAGCASTPAPELRSGATEQWQGRLAIKVSDPTPKAFAANFVLQGNAAAGQLTLSSPLGTTLAKIEWSPDNASLTTNGAPQRFESMQALALSALGVDVPVTQLFDWFAGTPAGAAGWEADLRDIANGRIAAKRTGTDLQAEIKILLER